MTPDISIITGTFNRLAYLQKMIQSARAAIAPALTYEFVIVDAGSTDGTLEYLKQQPDIRLIEHGALLGGLKAFGDGARAAHGDYVVLANDDVTFHPDSITRAWVHLQQTPTCGAVAFADNRPAPGYANDGAYKVQTITALRGKKSVSVPYAQVGMFRRELGNEAGWWGDKHPIMKHGHTYGGDSFLSARIWEMGYTVDAVDGVRIDDAVPPDALRERNYQMEQRNPAVYYKVYPTPPEIPPLENVADTPERLRILYLPIYEPGYGQYKRGLRDALARIGAVWEFDYLNDSRNLAEIVSAWQPHLMLTQLHGVNVITPDILAAVRTYCPHMVVANWNGDAYPEHLISPPMLALLRHVDIQLTVNESVLDTYRQHGIKAAYWQVAFEPVDEPLPVVAAHDVVFMANAYSPERRRLGDMLRSLPGVNVGLYGSSWRIANGNTTYQFAAGAALYRSAKIALGDNQYADQHGFVSNRLFEALGNGAFLLHQQVPGLEALTGLQNGVHYIEWKDTSDLQQKIRYWLMPKNVAERKRIAAAGEAFVREHHSFDARVKELFERILPTIGEPEHA